MLPSDGRARVVDFGLANLVGGRKILGGTPDWMAPEQWRLEPATERVDIWALGVLAYQLLEGAHPLGPAPDRATRHATVFDDTLGPAALKRDGVPDAIRGLVLRSLNRAPAARPSAADWASALREATAPGGTLTGGETPFRGLSAFEERHSQFFFGREVEVDAFLERLRDRPTLPVVGPSGAGKSSFVHAGVVPRLRARERWAIIAMRPGADPFGTLARQLLAAGNGDGSASFQDTPDVAAEEATRLGAQLRETPALLAIRLATIAATRQSSVLLVCDQLEELFTQGIREDDATRFVEMLMSAADDPRERVRVTYTLRDDFVGHLPEIEQVFVLRRLTRSDLRRTVTSPLERLGYRFEDPGIVDEMLRELSGSPFDLPLLQFACRTLWESRDTTRRLLLESSYREHGGVARALAHHADAVLGQLASRRQAIARQLLGALVIGNKMRRTAPLAPLLASLPDGASAVVDHFVTGRLLIKRKLPDESVVLEIAHESLLETWDQLARWLEESHEERRIVHELEEAAAFWIQRGRRPEHTPGADELTAARERIGRLGIAVSASVEALLQAGERRRRARQVRARSWLAGGVTLATVVTVGSLWVAGYFREQKNAAEKTAAALALAGVNKGKLDLTLEVRDRLPDGKAVPPEELPDLRVTLYGYAKGDLQLPGAALAADQFSVTRTGSLFHIEAPGGTTFLRIDGRGRAGEACAASWIRMLALPGYADHADPAAIVIPSCAASAVDSIVIPEGPFIYGGPGEPNTKFDAYLQPELVIPLGTYAIDRTETSNSTFSAFAALTALSGYAVPQYPAGHAVGGALNEPVTAIDAFEAEAFCHFMGKRLPDDYEWVKAARGALTIGTAINPHPRRLYPWGPHFEPKCVNLDGDADGFASIAPVDSMVCGASPYGVLNLAGNVHEWASRSGQTDLDTQLRVIWGGAAESPVDLEQTTTIFRTVREPRQFSLAIGVRCVTSGNPEQGSKWQSH